MARDYRVMWKALQQQLKDELESQQMRTLTSSVDDFLMHQGQWRGLQTALRNIREIEEDDQHEEEE